MSSPSAGSRISGGAAPYGRWISRRSPTTSLTGTQGSGVQSVEAALGRHRCMLESSELSRLSPITNTVPAGTGPAVLCLHANASTSAQWRSLSARLSGDHHLLAPDALGAGKSPAWPAGRVVTLRDEVALLEPVLASVAGPVFLVGHSYGAAVALDA